MLKTLSPILLVALYGPAAADCERELRGSLRWAEHLAREIGKVEVPPPETRRYINKEKAVALNQGNEARFGLLLKNPYYYPNELLNDFEKHTKAVSRLQAAKTIKDKATATAQMGSTLPAVHQSFLSYLEFDAKRSPRIFSKDGPRDLSFLFAVYPAQLGTTTVCLIGELQEPTK